MADVKVKAEIEVDQASAKASIDRAIRTPLQQIQTQAKRQFTEFTAGIQRGIGIRTDEGKGGAAGGLGKMLGTLSLISFGIGAAVTALNGIWDQAVKSSPALQGTMKMLDAAMSLFFKPFGDFLSSLLRPMAIWLIKFAVAWNKLFGGGKGETPATGPRPGQPGYDPTKEGLPQGDTGLAIVGENPTTGSKGFLNAAWDELNKAWDKFSKDWDNYWATFDPIKGLQESWKGILETFGLTDFDPIKGIMETWNNITATWDTVSKDFDPIKGIKESVEKIKTKWDELWGKEGTLGKIITSIQEKINSWKEKWDAFWSPEGAGGKLVTSIETAIADWKSKWDTFWSSEGLGGKLIGALDTGIKGLINGILGWVNGIIGWINQNGAWAGIHIDPIEGSYATGTDFVPETGLYRLHRGEAVIPADQNNGGTGGNMSISVNVSGVSVYNNYDITKLADDLARQLNVKMREKLPYGRGFT